MVDMLVGLQPQVMIKAGPAQPARESNPPVLRQLGAGKLFVLPLQMLLQRGIGAETSPTLPVLAGNGMRFLPVAAKMVGIGEMAAADVALIGGGVGDGVGAAAATDVNIGHVVFQLGLVREPDRQQNYYKLQKLIPRIFVYKIIYTQRRQFNQVAFVF